MAHNPNRVRCKCGKGKVSAWDGKCGHCRTTKEQKAHISRVVYGRGAPKPIDYSSF